MPFQYFIAYKRTELFAIIFCEISTFLCVVLSHAFQVLHIISMTTAVLLEVFAVNWFCQDFSLEFSNVLEAMYGLDWLNYPPRLRKTIIVTMARLQKPPCFTMGNWAKLDMLSFSNMLKFVYSFYTLISNVNK
ncbi:hypothetical protein JTB14_007872 [Gonioctena quinquepunctata]|nr:hypothetical protein JTB14_007872 [Gonioctena quinquepunctata]